jgi:hypothetical protein
MHLLSISRLPAFKINGASGDWTRAVALFD